MSCRKEGDRWAASHVQLSLTPLPCQLKDMLLISLLEIQMAKLLWLKDPDSLLSAQHAQMDILGCC